MCDISVNVSWFWIIADMPTGLCKPKDSEEGMDDSSSVEELKEPIPDLFNVLTEEEDLYKRWKAYTYPASAAKPGKHILLIKGN